MTRVRMPATSLPASGSQQQYAQNVNSRGQPRQVLLLLLVGAGDEQRRRAERVRRHRGVDARAAERDLFLDEAVVEAAAAEPAVRLGDLDVHQAGLPGLLQDLARKLAGLVEVAGARDDLLARELARGLDEGFLLFGEAEVHGAATL